MPPTNTQSLVSPVLLARGYGQGPDFKVCTRAAEADNTLDLPVIRMTGSSTVKDLQGDIMTVTALQDMANGDPDLTIFIDHNYSLPNDVFGKLYGKPEIRMVGHIADLHLAALADLSRDEPGLPHSKALDIYTQIKKGKIRHGSSVGCQVTQYQFLDPDDFFSGLLIEHVIWVEHSVVGIPASQRSWVEQAVKGMFERKLVEGDADAARQLAPAMKSMYWRDYATLLGYLESEGLRKDFERVKERGAAACRIMFDFKNDAFYLEERKGVRKSLSREETTELLEKELPRPVFLDDVDVLVEEDESDLDTTKTVCGKTSWPLMAIGTEWTGSKAENAIFAYAGGDDFSPAKAKQGFLYQDSSKDPKTRGAYKMPFCYGGDGGLKIVPLGVRACCNVLSGGRGGGKFGGDEAGMKTKCKTMYGRINSEFSPDPKWEVPWEKDEKSLATYYEDEMTFIQVLGFEVVEQDDTFFIKNADGELIPWLSRVLDTDNGSDLIRQDLAKDETKAVEVGADGSHVPFSGSHSHSHKAYDSQGSDEMHAHAHAHDGDAHHGHAHAEKSEEPKKQADITINEQRQEQGLPTIDNSFVTGEAVQVTGVNGLAGFQSTITTYSAEDAANITTVLQPTPDPVQLAYLAMYNDLGKKLGFPEHTLTTKCDLVPTEGDAGIVRSTLSALDDCSDAMMELAAKTDNYVDSLMGMMGVPDSNDMDGGQVTSLSDLISVMNSHAPEKQAEGRTLSGRNVGMVQQIHDLAVSLHPECCKATQEEPAPDSQQAGSVTVEDLQEEARRITGDPLANLSSFVGDALKSTLTRTLEGISAKAIIEQAVSTAVDSAMQEAHQSIDLLQREQMTLMQHLAKLSNMPLPRPTHLTRTVKPTSAHALQNVATYEDMLSASELSTAQTLGEVLVLTSIVEVPTQRDGREVRTKMRLWPAGVGVSVRPTLTHAQKQLMHWREWDAYESGEQDVLVPATIDDPAESLT